jgi:hypothetical protein
MDRKFTAAELTFLRAVAAGKVDRGPGVRGGQRYFRYDGGTTRDAGSYFRRLSPTYVVASGDRRGAGPVKLTDDGRAVLDATEES